MCDRSYSVEEKRRSQVKIAPGRENLQVRILAHSAAQVGGNVRLRPARRPDRGLEPPLVGLCLKSHWINESTR